ncbi:YgiT-type zinc finger protein [Pseudanabaena sp. BC1403]|uniref:YgiT-type zinc finger protein n=1 Tax=Pseudanabaena sp. BC1403 TaxID=2043171 RepID=UPI000CD80948|nr:YgiT-type zinc finger protein [Pseudanabaena sp. BC1403]
MNNNQEQLIEKRVTYSLELKGKFILIENVPARVNEETGEQFFAPSTVMLLQQIILDGQEPKRIIQTPVYSYAA